MHVCPNCRFLLLVKQVLPKSFGKSASLPPRRRMHSPTACASCSLYNVQRSVTERCVTLREITDRYGALMERYGIVTENIDFSHH